MKTPTFSVEVITLPVSDVDRAVRFYVDQVGFRLDVDYSPNDSFRVVQLTPPGSSCSIRIGNGPTGAPVGSLRNVYLVVIDLEAAELPARPWGQRRGDPAQDAHWCLGRRFRTGARPGRGDYASFADFSDPDGNSWVLQERGYGRDASPSGDKEEKGKR